MRMVSRSRIGFWCLTVRMVVRIVWDMETTATDKRIKKFADLMGKALAKLARTDAAAARRMSDAACEATAAMRAGTL